MKFLFDFSALYISYVSSCFILLHCVANRVEKMHHLLSSSGWLKMDHPDNYLEIIDRRRPDRPESKIAVNYLLATPVTEGNVVDKIQLAHQFLSCSYARVLMDLCEYEEGIGPQCRSKIEASESFDCLQDYQQVIRYKRLLVMRMTGALSSLQNLTSSQTPFENVVYEILKDLQKYLQQKTVVRPADEDVRAIRKIADAESKAIEQRSRVTLNRLFAFYNRSCWPLCYWIRNRGFSSPSEVMYSWLDDYAFNGSAYIVKKIKKKLNKIIRTFTDLHDSTSGFEYDPESHATRIITYDPDTMERVDKLNRLLENRCWDSMKPLKITERGITYPITIDDLLSPASHHGGITVVTKENLDTKLRRAHQFLSCQYSWITVECCHHVASMWASCRKSKDSVCSDKFLQILNDSDPSVLRMIDALSYFYKLSPDTVYNKGVFDLLKRFKNFYDDRTAQTDRDVMGLSPEIEKDISEIAHSSTEFFQRFCCLKCELESYYVPFRENNSTIDIRGETFKTRIFDLTFTYDVFE